VLLHAGAGAGAAERIAFIPDGWGSMWCKLADSKKILIVKSVLADRIARLDDDLELAVFGFGHRRTKNCEDVEELLTFSKLDRDLLAKRVGALSPRGKTPLALALERAAASLPADRSSGRILLLTDGADNCRRDACATAAEIAKLSPSRRIDVIAFGVKDNDMPRVSCIAKNSGGALRTARTAAELATAFDDLLLGSGSGTGDAPAIVSEVEDAKVALVEPSSLSVVARLSANSPELASGVFWRVRSVGEGEGELYAADQPPDRLALPAGTYRVEAQIDRVLASQSVEVAASGPTRVDMVLGAASLRLRASRPVLGGEAAGAASPADFFYTVYAASAGKDEPATTIAMSRDAEPVFVLPAGTYRVLAESGLARLERTIKLEAGSNQVENLTLDIGTLELEARAAPDDPPINRVVYTILVDDPVAATGVREIARSARPAATFALPVGVYTATVTVTASNGNRQSVPVQLEVLPTSVVPTTGTALYLPLIRR